MENELTMTKINSSVVKKENTIFVATNLHHLQQCGTLQYRNADNKSQLNSVLDDTLVT